MTLFEKVINQTKKVLMITAFTVFLLLLVWGSFAVKNLEYQWCLNSGASESYCKWQYWKRR